MIFLKERYYEAGGKSLKLLAFKLKKQKTQSIKKKDPTTNSIHCKLKDIQQSFETFNKNSYIQPKID